MKRKLAYRIVIIILIAVITTLHFITKSNNQSFHDFLKYLYLVPIILTAVQFGFKGGTAASIIISVLYSPQKLLSIGPQNNAIHDLLDVFLFVGIGIVTGLLVEKKNLAIKSMDSQLNKFILLENYTNSVLESIHLGIIAINKEYFITSMNHGAKEIIGVTNDCIGFGLMEVFPFGKDIELTIENTLNSNLPQINIEKKLFKDNKEVDIKLDIYPLSLENKHKGFVIIIEDITAINIMKTQMHRNDKLASVGQLATGIAHEIRNPLAIIKMIEQTMQKDLKNNEAMRQELSIIDEEVERANKVIKSLMEFSKPNKNEKGQFCINNIIEDVLVLTNKYTSQHKVNVEFIKTEIPDGFYDREQMIQALVNLVFNAVDAMPKGGAIRIETKCLLNQNIMITFSDTGQGIDETDLNKIFDPFFTTKTEGTGLGLPILYRIIDDHDGNINVKSTKGKGTIFEIYI